MKTVLLKGNKQMTIDEDCFIKREYTNDIIDEDCFVKGEYTNDIIDEDCFVKRE